MGATWMWVIWLLNAVLVVLTDAAADELGRPSPRPHPDMVYRDRYFYTSALRRGEASAPLAYLTWKA